MNKNILLVEDEAIIALNTKNNLTKYGYNVITACSGEDAIKEIDSNSGINIVLMDINLGDGIDGTEAASVILERHNLPVIFVSSHEEPDIVEKTEKITNYGYVVKSSSITVLDASIKMAFKLFQAKREAAHELAEKIKTEETLRHSENKFEALFMEASLPAVLTKFPEHYIVDVNKACTEMFGFSREEVIGKTTAELNVNRNKENLRNVIDELNKSGMVQDFIQPLYTKHGEELIVLSNYNRVTIEDEEYIIVSLQNITEQKKAEEKLNNSLETLRYVIKQSKNAYAILDTELRYIYVSDSFIKDYQIPVPDITGMRHYDIFPDLPGKWKEIHQLALQGTASRADEDPYPKGDGSIAWVKWECLPWYKKEGEIGGIILNTEVITNEIANAKVKDYMKMLKLSNAEKDKYISIMSHDLKGPLASFVSVSEEIAKNAPAMTTEDIQEIGTVMHETSRKLYSLLQNLLEWSKLNKGEVHIEEEKICIYEEINATISLFSRDAANKSIAIINEIDPELMIAVKKSVLDTLARNLLSNAIKFSNEAGKVKITADLTDRTVSITFADNGIGFNQEDLTNIFLKYAVKPQRGTFNEEGSGLGLILCNSLLEKYNGHMHLESNAGKGSRVTFTLPCLKLNIA